MDIIIIKFKEKIISFLRTKNLIITRKLSYYYERKLNFGLLKTWIISLTIIKPCTQIPAYDPCSTT